MTSSTMIEQSATINHDGNSLEGTLSTPASGTTNKVMLLIAGSGPLDRNQNSAKVQLNLFNAIAECLAAAGCASIRYDKRGCGNSEGNYDATGHSDLVADANAWLQFIKAHPTLARLPTYLLGHSEGAAIAPQLLSMGTDIAGQILLCPFVEPFEQVMRRQAEKALAEIAALPGFKGKLIRFFVRLSGDQMNKQKKLIERIRATKKPTITIKKQVINAKWIREMIELDMPSIYATVTVPTLAVGGEKDLQSLPEDVNKLRELITQAPLQTNILTDLTHILRSDPEEPSTQRYTQLSLLDVDARLLSTITTWLNAQHIQSI